MSVSIYSRINDVETWRKQAIRKLYVKAQVEKLDSKQLDARLNDIHTVYREKINDLLGGYGNTAGR